MAREVVLDANVIVAQLDSADSLAPAARDLASRLRSDGVELVLLDFVVQEALSVLCRRARERKTSPPDFQRIMEVVRDWASHNAIRWLGSDTEHLWLTALDVIEMSAGQLNFNDALLVVLQRQGSVGEVASFDQGLDAVQDFRRVC